MKRLIIACSLLLSSALLAQDLLPQKAIDIQISSESVDKNIERLYYHFGTVPVNSVSFVNYTVTNIGDFPMRMRDIRIFGAGFAARTNCDLPLPPRGGRCRFSIEYRPFWEGYSSGQFVMSFDPDYTVIVNLTGMAVR